MLQIKNVTITHQKDLKILLEDISFTLQKGDKAVIIGEEGNGKSTLLKWIFDPALIDSYAQAKGERIASGERLGYLAQELTESDRALSVLAYFEQSSRFYEVSPRDLAKLTQKLRLEKDFYYQEQSLGTLSGGEKVKAQLLRLLLEEPTVLLLDEPSNDLDLSTLEILEEIILDFPGIVLFISHDEVLIEHTANMVLHIEQVYKKRESRFTCERLSYADYVRTRQALFDRQNQQAAEDLRAKRIRDAKYQRIFERVEYEQDIITRQNPSGGRLLEKKMHAVKSMGHRFEREDENMTKRPIREDAIDFSFGLLAKPLPAAKVVLDYQLDELRIGEGDSARVLARNIRLHVQGGEKICIIGANGAGKTTLLRKIADQLLSRPDLAVIYMPQQYEESLKLEMDPVRYLMEVTDLKTARITDRHETANERKQREEREKQGIGVTERQWETHIRTYLAAPRFTEEEMHHPIRELSGGQKAKLFLLRMNLSQANVLILDEPTRNFSPLSGPVIRRMLREFPGAIISVSHDRKYMEEVCDKVLELTPEGLFS